MGHGGAATLERPATATMSSSLNDFGKSRSTGQLVALLAEFDSPDSLRAAAAGVHKAGYTRFDAHSPFPIHGIEKAAGIKRTRLPILVFAIGFLGTCTALFLQLWTNAPAGLSATEQAWNVAPNFLRGYNFVVSGKPLLSIPMFIPVTFELTVLFASLTAVFGMLMINNLPLFYNALFGVRRFAGVTSDKFFLVIEASDARFSEPSTRATLESLGGKVERVEELHTPEPPAWLRQVGIVVVMVALIPPLAVARARNVKTQTPRIHIVQDMDNQEKFKGQAASPIFADHRAARMPVGATPERPLGLTVARGELRDDDHFYRGIVNNAFVLTFPTTDHFDIRMNGQVLPGTAPLKITPEFIERGRDRFNIYCTPCHGMAGDGNGAVSNRAIEMQESTWVQAADLHTAEIRGRAVGHIFNTITNGIRTMPQYGDQIPERDRWAIVAYVRALQRMEAASLNDVPADERKVLENR